MARIIPFKTIGLTVAGLGLAGITATQMNVSLAPTPGNLMSVDLTIAQTFTVNIGF